MLSLFGIVLAIGIVVDDAIVVVENTTRHLADGLQPKEAAVKAMSEITGPVIATTLVLLAVFVPSAFMGGITGQLFRQFSLTISGAVLISTLNALTLSPALCGLILRAPKESSFVGFRWFNKGFDGATSVYGFVIRWFVRLVLIVMVAYAALVGTTGVTFSALPTGFVPDEDQGYLFVNVQLPDAASSERTRAVMRQVEEIYSEIPGVADNVSIAGYSLLGGYAGSNLGFSIVILDPWDERTDPEKSLPAILDNLKQRFSQDSRRRGVRVCATADRRPRRGRRLSDGSARSGRCGIRVTASDRRRSCRRGECSKRINRTELCVSSERAAVVRRRRSRQSQEHERAAGKRVWHLASVSRFGVRQRLHLQQSLLSSSRPIRSRVPCHGRRHCQT